MHKAKTQKKPSKLYLYICGVALLLVILIILRFTTQNQLTFYPLKDRQDISKLPVEVTDQKDILFATDITVKSGEYLITKKVNGGSGGGANYNVYKLNKDTFTSIYPKEAYSCSDPQLVKNGTALFFENFGSHCDWLDTGSGKGEKIEINLE